MVESSQFLFVLLRLLNLALPPVLTPKANTSVAVIFPFLSNYITVQATRTMVSEKLVRLAWAVLSPCKGHQDSLVVLCWLHNAFVTFIWSSACKKTKSQDQASKVVNAHLHISSKYWHCLGYWAVFQMCT